MEADRKTVICMELKKQRSIILPLIPMNSTWFAQTAITTAFLGRLGKLELAAGTLGFTFANITGFSILTGLCLGMVSIGGQACGANNPSLLLRTLFMTIILLLVTSLPISILWLYVDKILLIFGQQQDVALLAKRYVFFLILDLVATSFLGPLRAYYSAQGITVPTMFSSAMAIAIHVPLNVILCKARGIEGAALAVGLTDFTASIMLAIHLCATESWKEIDGGAWWKHRVEEWLRLLRLSAQCCISGCLEWWCYEILILLSGRLPDATRSVAVLTIVLNFDYMLYGVMISIATCASTRVANELGAGDPQASRRSACISLLLSTISGCAGGALMLAFKGIWGLFFSRDEGVVAGVKRMLPVMAAFEAFNFPFGVCGGIVRGTTSPSVSLFGVLGFYLVGLPLAIELGFRAGLGLLGLFLGFAAGSGVSAAAMGVLVGRIDWVGEAGEARKLAAEDIPQE